MASLNVVCVRGATGCFSVVYGEIGEELQKVRKLLERNRYCSQASKGHSSDSIPASVTSKFTTHIHLFSPKGFKKFKKYFLNLYQLGYCVGTIQDCDSLNGNEDIGTI